MSCNWTNEAIRILHIRRRDGGMTTEMNIALEIQIRRSQWELLSTGKHAVCIFNELCKVMTTPNAAAVLV